MIAIIGSVILSAERSLCFAIRSIRWMAPARQAGPPPTNSTSTGIASRCMGALPAPTNALVGGVDACMALARAAAVFGEPIPGARYWRRAGAYAVIADGHGRVAMARHKG